jgi:hypothetical protein
MYTIAFVLCVSKGKCRRAEEIEEGDRNREMLKRKIQKRKRGRDNNAVLQSWFVGSWRVRNTKGRWSRCELNLPTPCDRITQNNTPFLSNEGHFQ